MSAAPRLSRDVFSVIKQHVDLQTLGRMLCAAKYFHAYNPDDKELLRAKCQKRIRYHKRKLRELEHACKPPKPPKKLEHVCKPPKPPKKPRSAYIYFSVDARKVISAANPGWGFADITKEVATVWHALDRRERLRYERLAEQDKERYKQKMGN